jgi:hypothetical protein
MLRGEVIPSLALHALGLGCEEEEPSRRLKDYIPLKCCCSLVPTTRYNSAIPPRLPGVLYSVHRVVIFTHCRGKPKVSVPVPYGLHLSMPHPSGTAIPRSSLA